MYVRAKEGVVNALNRPYNIYNLHEARRLLEPGLYPVEKSARFSKICPSLVSAKKERKKPKEIHDH